MMNSALKLMNYALKMMNFAFKLMKLRSVAALSLPRLTRKMRSLVRFHPFQTVFLKPLF